MKFKNLILPCSIFLLSCQNPNEQSGAQKSAANDTVLIEDAEASRDSVETPAQAGAVLALSPDGLQVVSIPSGSARELKTGMEMNDVLKIVSKVLTSEIPEPQINTECGAGPMTMSVFKNGLVLLFQQVKSNPVRLEFVGWSVSNSAESRKLTTMAGIGPGSTRADLESAYQVAIKETSLGTEFATVPHGLYGILDGSSENSKISFMWSGTSCNFR